MLVNAAVVRLQAADSATTHTHKTRRESIRISASSFAPRCRPPLPRTSARPTICAQRPRASSHLVSTPEPCATIRSWRVYQQNCRNAAKVSNNKHHRAYFCTTVPRSMLANVTNPTTAVAVHVDPLRAGPCSAAALAPHGKFRLCCADRAEAVIRDPGPRPRSRRPSAGRLARPPLRRGPVLSPPQAGASRRRPSSWCGKASCSVRRLRCSAAAAGLPTSTSTADTVYFSKTNSHGNST
jgi:hypothetical protein